MQLRKAIALITCRLYSEKKLSCDPWNVIYKAGINTLFVVDYHCHQSNKEFREKKTLEDWIFLITCQGDCNTLRFLKFNGVVIVFIGNA